MEHPQDVDLRPPAIRAWVAGGRLCPAWRGAEHNHTNMNNKKTKIYRVRVEQAGSERFTIRAHSAEEAKGEAEGLVSGDKLQIVSSDIVGEEEDNGQEADND
jgi:hypothetical protein